MADGQRAALVEAQDLGYRQALHDDQARVTVDGVVEDSGIAEYSRTSLAVPFVTVYSTRSPIDPQKLRATDSLDTGRLKYGTGCIVERHFVNLHCIDFIYLGAVSYTHLTLPTTDRV